MSSYFLNRLLFLLPLGLLLACDGNRSTPGKDVISTLHLKSGQIISCGPPDNEFGRVSFEITSNEEVQKDFNLALELLHSFEYDEAEKLCVMTRQQDAYHYKALLIL
jgi:hypothetical protein